MKYAIGDACAARIKAAISKRLLDFHNVSYQDIVDLLDQEGMADPEDAVQTLTARLDDGPVRNSILGAAVSEAYLARKELQELQGALRVLARHIDEEMTS